MKMKTLFLLISGVTLLASVTQAGCAQKSSDLSFTQGQHLYVIDTQTAGVSVARADGSPVETMGSPAAGASGVKMPLSPNIIHYLLPGKGSISGLVWDDLDGDQTPDAGEHGMPAVRVYIDNDNSTTYTKGEPFELTDADGLYTLTKIKAGDRNISIDTSTLPAGYGVTTSLPMPIHLAPNQEVADADFATRDRAGKIGGTILDQTDSVPISWVSIYLDLNNDDKFSSGEPHGTTGASGSFLIANLPGGTYKVRVDNQTLDPKYHRTPVSGANPTEVTLASGGSLSVDLAYLHKATICGTLQNSNGQAWANLTIFIDLNNNGAYDSGEPKAVTDASGRYCFDELFPGTYTLLIQAGQLPAGYDLLVSPGTITVGAGEEQTANFVTHQPVTITGIVWDDASGNHVPEPGENGLADITVYLDANNNGVLEAGELSTRTDPTGAYAFTGLVHGYFYIRADDTALRSAYIQTTTANPVQIALEPGQVYDGAMFGYQKKLAPVHSLQDPTRISWGSDGKLYVSDNAINSVFIYDSALNITGELKKLDKPLGVTTDAAGNIYVGNQGRKNVEVYDPLGNLLRTIGAGSIATPNDLAFDQDNNIYILDSANDTVLVFDQEGNPRTAIGSSPQIGYGVSIAIQYGSNGSGELYVADQTNCTIHVFALDGAYIKAIGASGSLYTTNWDGKFAGLTAVVIDNSGNIHGLDNSLNVIQVFEPRNGTFLRSYNAYPANNEFRLNLQTDIAIHPIDNRVIIANVATGSVETVTTVTAP